jgi:hypothetical protein
MLELAYEMDDCPTETQINRDNLVKRDIKDKKKATAKQKMLTFYVSKLDSHRGTQQYADYERKMGRLKQQIMLQNQNSGHGGEGIGRSLRFNGENLADYILRNIPLDFDEVTDQDNVLEYLQELEDFEGESNGEEITQCKKMLARLQGRTDGKFQEKIEELLEKVQNLEDQIDCSSSFKAALKSAQQTLRKSHEQEIKDGYNLIPKAADLIKGTVKIGGREMSATDFAAVYRDKILCCDNFLEAFMAIISICALSTGSPHRSNDGYRITSRSPSSE